MSRLGHKNQTFQLLTLVLCLLAPSLSQAISLAFPQSPHLDVTPGTLCKKPDSYRYPERIGYCERDVDSKTKYQIIDFYDKKFGYRIRATGRDQFKIDHLIPLCMGGSNEVANLWPQHRSIYELTDPLEPELCDKLAAGRITQEAAVEMILEAKSDPSKAAEYYHFVNQQ